MKALYFDCFSGISGDMTLGALIDLGLDKVKFIDELAKLKLDEYKISIQSSIKNGITGTDVNVILLNEQTGHDDLEHHDHHDHNHHDSHSAHEDMHSHVQQHLHAELEQQAHEHNHIHTDEHNHAHTHEHNARNLKDIETLIENSTLTLKVKNFSKKVFEEIARAEAKVHNKAIDEVHFHEVGAVDSIVDIVGAAICLDMLGVEKVYSSQLHEGTGFIKCQHGILPVPVPAVMQMLVGSNIPVVTVDINTELVTPTGMGIIKCLASGYGSMPAMNVQKIGYGMGKKDTGKFNALRVVMGELEDEPCNKDEIVMLETNIDDMNPEILGHVMEKLLEAGALDVYYTPIYMKKNRPGTMLTVLADEKAEKKLTDIIMLETSTLGIRRTTAERYIMGRTSAAVATKYGEIKVKVAEWNGASKFSPEYEDCRRAAREKGIALKEVYDEVIEKARRLFAV